MRIAISILTLLALFSPAHGSIEPGEWKKIGTAAGSITISKRDVPGTQLLAYRAEGVLEAPLDKLVTVVADTGRRHEWAERVKYSEVVEETSMTDRIEYTHAATPWPLKDRDFVYRIQVQLDPIRKRAHFQMTSVEHPKRPPGDPVRGEIRDSSFTLTFVDAGRTHLAAEVLADPKGAIPIWLVNIVQKSMPEKALRGLLKQVKKPGVEGHPLVRDWMTAASQR